MSVKITVRSLATEAGMDLDEALVRLWEAGFQELTGPNDAIPVGAQLGARRALHLVTKRELTSASYWMSQLGLEPHHFANLLKQLGFTWSERSRKVPRGSVSVLRAVSRRERYVELELGNVGTTSDESREARETDRGLESRPTKGAPPPVNWRTPGHKRQLTWLTEEEVLAIHYALVEDFTATHDPIEPAGVRSRDLLVSAIYRPETSIGGILKYPTVETAAAALLHSLILNHAFHNGNKRTALVSMLVFMDRNGLVLTCEEDELFRLVLLIARHHLVQNEGYGKQDMADREVLATADWIHENSRLVEKGERPIQWRKLKRILREYGCEFSMAGGVGNRINIRRITTRSRKWGRKPVRVELQTQVFYRDDGSEATVEAIKRIRQELELDDMHGVDSWDFYARSPTQITDFIAEYRKILERLATL